jgi:hypothetical protein
MELRAGSGAQDSRAGVTPPGYEYSDRIVRLELFELFNESLAPGYGWALSIKPARRSSLYTVFREMDKLCAALEMFPPLK